MNLEVKINEEIKSAMKSGDKLRLETLRSIRAAIIEFAKSGIDRAMDEADEIKILNNLAKKRRDAIDMYKKAGRDDLSDKEALELEVINEFLPKQLSDEEIAFAVKGIIEKTGATSQKDMGKVMGLSMKELAGKADGNKVKTIVQSLLSAE